MSVGCYKLLNMHSHQLYSVHCTLYNLSIVIPFYLIFLFTLFTLSALLPYVPYLLSTWQEASSAPIHQEGSFIKIDVRRGDSQLLSKITSVSS